MPSELLVFTIFILVISVVLHEVAHGYMADHLGDPTARFAGRLTLNPLPHLDIVGSLLLPAFLVLSGSPFLIGWAKPVPYNPYNLRHRRGEALVAAAGPAANIVLAIIFALALRLFADALSPELIAAFSAIVFINMLLALFNLLPLPPLDGSKILPELLPGPLARGYYNFRLWFERFGMFGGLILILLFLFLLAPYFFAGLRSLFLFLTGTPL